MKRIFYCLMSVCIIISSCKKEHAKDTAPDQNLYKVAFKVGFSQATGNFKTNGLTTNGLVSNAADTSLTNHLTILYYAVYDSVGNNVHTTKQLSTDVSFGSYTDNLHVGKYTVVIAGGQSGFVLIPDFTILNLTTSKLSTDVVCYASTDISGNFVPGNFVKDAFVKKLALTVSTSNTNQSISLDRITSNLVVNIADAIPTNAGNVGITVSSANEFYLATLTTNATIGNFTITKQLLTTDIGTTNYKISTLLLPLPTPTGSVDLVCKTSANVVIAEKIIPNVNCQPNTETILTGNLFGGNGTTSTDGFQIKIDTAWGTTPILKSF
jgi:hypothetical protein